MSRRLLLAFPLLFACTVGPKSEDGPSFGNGLGSAAGDDGGDETGGTGSGGAQTSGDASAGDTTAPAGGDTGMDEPVDPDPDDDDTGPATPPPAGEGSTSSSTGDEPEPIEPEECPGAPIDDALPAMIAGTTAGAINTLSGSCGGDDGPDAAYAFVAPAAGVYVFDTSDSDFDTVVYAVSGAACDGPELGCDDDGAGSLHSRLELSLDADEEIVLVVDGYSATTSGNFALGVTTLGDPCEAATDLGSALPATASGTTAGDSALDGSCGGDGAAEAAFVWTAPAAGDYTVSTEGSDFDTVLYVLDGACGGPELDCDDDGGTGTTSGATRALAAGAEVGGVGGGGSS
ncbi:MAG: hypothetical protein AAF721_16080, partial [Myxococcota bacterium]